MNDPARSPEQRKRDTLARLENDIDAWVSSAAGDVPYLVPLSFRWDGESVLISTPAASPTGRNLQRTRQTRIALGATRDVVLVEGTVDVLGPEELADGEGDAFAAKAGFDPRSLKTRYLYFRIRPRLIQTWREVNELADRDLMRDGAWLV